MTFVPDWPDYLQSRPDDESEVRLMLALIHKYPGKAREAVEELVEEPRDV